MWAHGVINESKSVIALQGDSDIRYLLKKSETLDQY